MSEILSHETKAHKIGEQIHRAIEIAGEHYPKLASIYGTAVPLFPEFCDHLIKNRIEYPGLYPVIFYTIGDLIRPVMLVDVSKMGLIYIALSPPTQEYVTSSLLRCRVPLIFEYSFHSEKYLACLGAELYVDILPNSAYTLGGTSIVLGFYKFDLSESKLLDITIRAYLKLLFEQLRDGLGLREVLLPLRIHDGSFIKCTNRVQIEGPLPEHQIEEILELVNARICQSLK